MIQENKTNTGSKIIQGGYDFIIDYYNLIKDPDCSENLYIINCAFKTGDVSIVTYKNKFGFENKIGRASCRERV